MILTAKYRSPVGNLLMAKTDKGLFRATFRNTGHLEFHNNIKARFNVSLQRDDGAFEREFAYLDKYFSGMKLKMNIPVSFMEGTSFQLSVWRELAKIPYGEVAAYGDISCRVGNPKASRAVGGACGKNPVVFFIPCHRVVASNGNLGGFSAGIDIKISLLNIEGYSVYKRNKVEYT